MGGGGKIWTWIRKKKGKIRRMRRRKGRIKIMEFKRKM
jgi:hypothetical protein